MAVIKTTATTLAKDTASLKPGDTLEIHGGGSNLAIALPHSSERITIRAVDKIMSLRVLTAGPVLLHQSLLGLSTTPYTSGVSGSPAAGTLLDVICDESVMVDGGTDGASRNAVNGISWSGNGKVLIKSQVQNVYTGIVVFGDMRTGGVVFEADGYQLTGIGNDGFDLSDFSDAYVHDGKFFDPAFQGGHADPLQTWQRNKLPNGRIRVNRNLFSSAYQGIYPGLLKGQPLADANGNHVYAHDYFEAIGNTIIGGTTGGIMALETREVLLQGNDISTTAAGPFQCGIRTDKGWLDTCGKVTRTGNVIHAWTDAKGYFHPAIVDPVPA